MTPSHLPVRLDRDGALLRVTIDRPGALNAIDFEVMSGLEGAIARARDEPGVRALVLRGAGERAFVSGGDLRAFAALQSAEDARRMARRMKAILEAFESLDCWVVACVNGPAFGGGCETLVACDVCIASAQASFGWTQTRFAVPCGWGGMTRLVERVGRQRALRWLATRAVVPPDEALAAGLIDEVVPHAELDAHVDALARRMAQIDRAMIAELKQAALRARQLPRAEAIAAELEPFARAWASPAHHVRVAAFLDRRGEEE